MGEYEDYLSSNSKFLDSAKDTPVMSQNWCPVCEPDKDPSVEILQVLYCSKHPNPGTPGQDPGEADGQVRQGGYLSGSSPAEVVHRRSELEVPPNREPQDPAAVYMGDGDCG